jgi:anti-sigma B factor antagonist
MQTRERMDQGVQILVVEGEIDLACSPELRAILHRYAKQKAPALLLDLQGVTYVDSSGLATLVEYVRLAQAFAGKLGLAHVSERVRTILELLRLTEFFRIYPTIDEARSALLAAPGA